MERLMLARRWWWSCVYVASTVIAFVLSSLAGEAAWAWRMGLAWLFLLGYTVVVAKTRTRRGLFGSRLRSELEQPEFWRETRTLSGGRRDGGPGVRSDVIDAARRDASDWLSGIALTTVLAVFLVTPTLAEPPAPVLLAVIGGASAVLTLWGLVRARVVMTRLDRADPTGAGGAGVRRE